MKYWLSALALGFFGFILWVIYLANTGQQSIFFQFIAGIPYGDKLGHFGLFGTLTLVANLALSCRYWRIGRVKILRGTLLVSLFALLEEGSQSFLPNRTLDWQDLLADAVGIILFSFVAMKMYAWMSRR
ncbi:VanZ family protein [Shewanella corallii]|uniref:VanZ family protein n=1 Tax=Shewanella corallii TaxID=560080 RepID=A0ABT0NCZ3_9GAMM|nr:VanZ family protein [Shewanella corallii]MCL2915652.1 VanZ family protein [Shewanella corallii]